jgi:ribonuclease BN (tRNA processing enzyme)
LTFLGVGEAFDERFANSSTYIQTGSRNYLVDCGYRAPYQLWSVNADPNLLDVVYLTHFHADHAFGLSALLVRMKEDGRSKPLPILGQAGIKGFVERLCNFAYPGSFKSLGFPVECIEVSPHKELRLGGHLLTFHPTRHVITNLAFRLAINDFSLYISGDGELTEESEAAFRSSKYSIQECFAVDAERDYHNSFSAVERVLTDNGPKPVRTFLVHVSRNDRERLQERLAATGLPAVLPRDLQMYDLD